MDPQAEASNVSKLPPKVTLGVLEALIEGKVQSVEQPNESEWTYFNVQLKAKDEYSRPATVQISQPANTRPFAKVDEIIKVKVALGGYGRRHNGQLFISNTLQFVESF